MSSIIIPEGRQGLPLEFYDRKAVVGNGAFGTVHLYKLKAQWLGNERYLNEPEEIAVKVILINEGRSQRELQIALSIQNENIVKLLGAQETKDCIYIKMEFAKTDLSRLKETLSLERYSVPAVSSFAHQILSGLCYLHNKSIAHRDIKPQNVLAFWETSKESTPFSTYFITLKLTDFGLSRFIPPNSASASTVGTRLYMAPEVALALSKGETTIRGDCYMKADVFSAGVVIYELLFDERPFCENDLRNEVELNLPERGFETDAIELMNIVKFMLRWRAEERCEATTAENCFPSKMKVPIKAKKVEETSLGAEIESDVVRPKDSIVNRGPSLNDYDRGEMVGAGTFSNVYTFTLKDAQSDAKLPRVMAVKIVLKLDDSDREREMNILSALVHRNIATVYGIEESGPLVYVKMELASFNLSYLMRSNLETSRPEHFSLLASQVTLGLAALHSVDIAHRNLRPRNILVTGWDEKDIRKAILKLCDFDLSRSGTTARAEGATEYTAPEVAKYLATGGEIQPVDYKVADVFSLGVVFFKLLVGRAPFGPDELVNDTRNELQFDNLLKKVPGLAGRDGTKSLLAGMLRWRGNDRLSVPRVLESMRTGCDQQHAEERYDGPRVKTENRQGLSEQHWRDRETTREEEKAQRRCFADRGGASALSAASSCGYLPQARAHVTVATPQAPGLTFENPMSMHSNTPSLHSTEASAAEVHPRPHHLPLFPLSSTAPNQPMMQGNKSCHRHLASNHSPQSYFGSGSNLNLTGLAEEPAFNGSGMNRMMRQMSRSDTTLNILTPQNQHLTSIPPAAAPIQQMQQNYSPVHWQLPSTNYTQGYYGSGSNLNLIGLADQSYTGSGMNRMTRQLSRSYTMLNEPAPQSQHLTSISAAAVPIHQDRNARLAAFAKSTTPQIQNVALPSSSAPNQQLQPDINPTLRWSTPIHASQDYSGSGNNPNVVDLAEQPYYYPGLDHIARPMSHSGVFGHSTPLNQPRVFPSSSATNQMMQPNVNSNHWQFPSTHNPQDYYGGGNNPSMVGLAEQPYPYTGLVDSARSMSHSASFGKSTPLNQPLVSPTSSATNQLMQPNVNSNHWQLPSTHNPHGYLCSGSNTSMAGTAELPYPSSGMDLIGSPVSQSPPQNQPNNVPCGPTSAPAPHPSMQFGFSLKSEQLQGQVQDALCTLHQLKGRRRQDKLVEACRNGDLQTAQSKISKGACANTPNVKGDHPLAVACERGHYEIARLLLSKGASVHVVGNDGKSPLHRASELDNALLVQLLIDYGADVNRPDSLLFNTPLHLAYMKGHHEVIDVLFRAGANRNAVNRFNSPVKGSPTVTRKFKVLLEKY